MQFDDLDIHQVTISLDSTFTFLKESPDDGSFLATKFVWDEQKAPVTSQFVVKIYMNFSRLTCIDDRSNLPLQKTGARSLNACILHHVIMSSCPSILRSII
jgi:hypothetical protein